MYKKQILIEGVGMAPSFVPKRKFWIGAAIGALGSIISSAMSSSNTSDSEKFSRQMTHEQIAANRENWMMQNAYNSPNAMVQRATQAGFTPLQALGQTPAGSVAPATPVNARQTNEGANFVSQMFDSVSKFVNNLPYLNAEKEKNLADAEKAKADAEKAKQDAEYQKQMREFAKVQTDMYNREYGLKVSEDTFWNNRFAMSRDKQTGELIPFVSSPREEDFNGDAGAWNDAITKYEQHYEPIQLEGVSNAQLYYVYSHYADTMDHLSDLSAKVTSRDVMKLSNLLRSTVLSDQLRSPQVLSAFRYEPLRKQEEMIAQTKNFLAAANYSMSASQAQKALKVLYDESARRITEMLPYDKRQSDALSSKLMSDAGLSKAQADNIIKNMPEYWAGDKGGLYYRGFMDVLKAVSGLQSLRESNARTNYFNSSSDSNELWQMLQLIPYAY